MYINICIQTIHTTNFSYIGLIQNLISYNNPIKYKNFTDYINLVKQKIIETIIIKINIRFA